MVHLKLYLPLQIILLFALHLLTADDKLPQHKKEVSGSPKIIDATNKKSVVNDAADKDINDLLHKMYNKFHDDLKRHVSVGADNQHKDNSKSYLEHGDNKVISHSTEKHAKKTNKIAFKDLETTIDKLIDSMTKASKDNKYESDEINKGISKMSKFADLTGVTVSDETVDNKITIEDNDHSTPTKKNAYNVESFNDFKKRFFDTFMKNDKKEQNIVYHGKRDANTRSTISWNDIVHAFKRDHTSISTGNTQHKDAVNTQHKDAGNMQHKDAVNTQHKDAVNTQHKDAINTQHKDATNTQHKDATNTQHKDATNTQHKDAGNTQHKDGSIDNISLKTYQHDNARINDLSALYKELKKETTQEVRNKNEMKQAKEEDWAKRMKMEKVKKDLVDLLDMISNKDTKQDTQHRDSGSYITEKKPLIQHDNLRAEKLEDSLSKLYADSNVKKEQLKKRLLTVVRSIENQLGKEIKEDGKPKVSKGDSDHFERELDNIASGNTKADNTHYATNAERQFLDALKGFAVASASPKSKDNRHLE